MALKDLLLFSLTAPIILSGCLPLVAATAAPQRGFIKPELGTARSNVISQYGQPDSIRREGDQEVDLYESGDGPRPGERGEWVFEAVLIDAVTLGLFEISFFPELTRLAAGPKQYNVFSIRYSPSGQVVCVSQQTKNAVIEPADNFRWER